MKQQHQRLQAGVWLDNTQAIIIANNSQTADGTYSVQQKIKSGGNQSGGSEHSMNNAKQSDMLKYFKSVATALLSYDEILIFGPGKSQEQFQNHLQEDAQFKNKKITIDSANQLTDNQMISKVRDFFDLAHTS